MIPVPRIHPLIILAIVWAIVSAGMWWRITTLRADLAESRAETATALADLAAVTANRDSLRAVIRSQNSQIDQLRARALQAERAANSAATRVLRDASRERARIQSDAESGPEAMNKWLRYELLQE